MNKDRLDGIRHVNAWQAQWPPFESDETLAIPVERSQAVLAELGERLRDNYPFFHPVYAGQMLKPPHPVALAAYAMAQRINPNNHALDGGPATAALERECVAAMAGMFGYDPATSLGHLTSSGTIANLEALWIARQLKPGAAVAYSAEAHYTHGRMCEVLGISGVVIPADARGRMDMDALRARLAVGDIGTVVVTAGTTALGAVDPIADVLALRAEFDFRIHVDAAYGGFFTLLANDSGRAIEGTLSDEAAAAFRAIRLCDSVVVDPHKHGLQPYGCGSVLFRDASVGRFYKHDSPYTYFTSDELHLGEISLECSRAGAAAAALWATLQCFPLAADDGLGVVLRKTRAAAQLWAELIERSGRLRLLVEPALDILAFYPLPDAGERRVSEISALTGRVFEFGMASGEFYLAKMNVSAEGPAGGHDLVWDQPAMTILRSVLMKPEHLAFVPELHRRVLENVEKQRGSQ